MTQEHLLLTGLGTSIGAVLSLLARLHDREPVTHLWVIATNSPKTNVNLDRSLVRPLRESFPGIKPRLRKASLEDILSSDDHDCMTEILYRVVLQAEHWRKSKPLRRVSIGLVGGRKTMGASLQQATTFFEVDAVYHMAYNGDDPPETMPEIKVRKDNLHLVCLSDHVTPWRNMLEGPWQHRYPDRPLDPKSFPLSDDWNDTELADYNLRTVASADGPRLSDCLQKIATLAGIFAAPESLAAGMGGQFLRHDLRPLLDNLPDHLPAVRVLKAYQTGLTELFKKSNPEGFASLNWSEIEAICDDALHLAVGKPVARVSGQPPCWRAEKSLELQLNMPPRLRTLRSLGMDRHLFLLVLRNLLVNVLRHGQSDHWNHPVALVEITEADGKIVFCISNDVPPEGIAGLKPYVRNEQELPDLLEPRLKVGANAGDGLGLFTVAEVMRRMGDSAPPPRLEPWPSPSPRFVVRLTFHRNETTGGS